MASRKSPAQRKRSSAWQPPTINAATWVGRGRLLDHAFAATPVLLPLFADEGQSYPERSTGDRGALRELWDVPATRPTVMFEYMGRAAEERALLAFLRVDEKAPGMTFEALSATCSGPVIPICTRRR
jgi:hypothetical protein